MLALNDGRNELWQWDTGRKLTVDAECSQVHFSNKVFGRSIDMPVIDGVVEIPDFLLQTDKDLTAWAFVGTAENGYTKISKVFKVNKRNKPADYVFSPTEQTTLAEIKERLDDLEAMQDPDAIKNAVDDYLASNPIKVEETDPTVPDWAKKPTKPSYTAEEVGALPSDTVIPVVPEALPNPQPLTFTGAVDVTYDGSKPVEVVIPQGGGGIGTWELLAEGTAGTTNSTKAYVNLASFGKSQYYIEVDFHKTTVECTPTISTPGTGMNFSGRYKTSVYAQKGIVFAENNGGEMFGYVGIIHGFGTDPGIYGVFAPSPRGGNYGSFEIKCNPFVDSDEVLADYKVYGR